MARASQPIQRRLMAMMLVTSAAAIVLTSAALVVYEVVTSRNQSLVHVATLARIVAANSTAALAFRDEGDAEQVLATLATEPSIVAAALYDADGEILARYAARDRAEQAYPAVPGAAGYRFGAGHLIGFEPVSEPPGRRLGTLYVLFDTRALYQRFWLYGAIAAAVMAASLLLAYFLSRALQAGISQPILSLADTARAISERADFSVRAPPDGEGELRLLTTAFNQMLERIETQNGALQKTLSERAEAERKLQRQLGRLDLLHRTTRAIGERQDLDSIFKVILRNLEDNLVIDFACICMYEEQARKLVVAGVGLKSAARAAELGMELRAEPPIEDDGLARCLRGVFVYEPDTSEVWFPIPQRFAAAGLHSLAAAPLVVENHVFGMLLVARAERAAFSSSDCEFLRQLSEHVALAAHQIALYTQLQQAYDELQESQRTILQQERLRALGQMASGIAHDINNAISPVGLYVELLLERERGLSDRAREQLHIIQRSIEDVAQTVARMREFYRQRERQSDLAPLDLNPLIEQVLALTRARWCDLPQERGVVIRVKVDLAPNLPQVLGTEGDIRDALTNLVFNAVDAMPEGGTLTLRTRAVAPADDRAMTSVDLEVADTGVGMDEQTRQRCMEPFFTTKGERGTGMGLAMVYGMAQRHGAQMEIDSLPGRGTTVRLHFVEAPLTTAPQIRPSATPPPRPLKLLVIDDDPLVIESLQQVLQNEGHSVTAVDSGQAGIDTFTAANYDAEPFDAVMTDLGMPYVDGRAVAAAVKAISPHTPVLLLTGWGQRLSTEQSIPAHVDRLLSKPPKLAELRQALTELTARAGPG